MVCLRALGLWASLLLATPTTAMPTPSPDDDEPIRSFPEDIPQPDPVTLGEIALGRYASINCQAPIDDVENTLGLRLRATTDCQAIDDGFRSWIFIPTHPVKFPTMTFGLCMIKSWSSSDCSGDSIGTLYEAQRLEKYRKCVNSDKDIHSVMIACDGDEGYM